MLSTKRDMQTDIKVGVQNIALKNSIEKQGEKMASACSVLTIAIAVGTALKEACDD